MKRLLGVALAALALTSSGALADGITTVSGDSNGFTATLTTTVTQNMWIFGGNQVSLSSPVDVMICAQSWTSGHPGRYEVTGPTGQPREARLPDAPYSCVMANNVTKLQLMLYGDGHPSWVAMVAIRERWRR